MNTEQRTPDALSRALTGLSAAKRDDADPDGCTLILDPDESTALWNEIQRLKPRFEIGQTVKIGERGCQLEIISTRRVYSLGSCGTPICDMPEQELRAP